MKTPRRTETLSAAFDCTTCGNTVHFTAGRPDRDPSTGGLICASCKFAPPAAPAAVVVAGCLCADIDGSDRPCLVCDAAAFVSPASTPIPAAPIECPCGNTIHFTMGAPDRDAGGRLICSTCKWGAPPVPAAVVVAPAFKVQLVQRGAQWTAVPWGKMAPIVRPVPGNTRMAGAATWATQEEARAELPTLCGCSVEVVSVEPAAPISETRAVPRPITPLTSDETITALAASVDRVAPPPSVTAADLSRHAVRMRAAGIGPVTRETCDPHERRFFSVGGGR